MTRMEERIRQLVGEHVESAVSIADTLSEGIAKAGERLVQCLLNDGRILVAASGPSSAFAEYFAALMMNRFDAERPPLPVISLCPAYSALSLLAEDGHPQEVFARPLRATGLPNDVLLAMSLSGNSDSILQAVSAAGSRGLDSIVLTGREGGVLASHLGPGDMELRIPLDNAARIREVHLLVLHCFCDVIEQSLFGQLMG